MLRIDGTWIMGPVSTLRGVTVRGVTVTIWQLVRNGSVSSFRPRMTYTIFASQQTCSA